MKILVGTDPECFIFNKKSGQYISADGIIPGSKEDPFSVDCGAVQVDGLAAEFNINPVDNEDDFVKNIQTVKAQLLEMITEVDKDFELHFIPHVDFNPEYFQGLSAKQKILGCDPDFNFEGMQNHSPLNANTPCRQAAGHIHIGWTSNADVTDPLHFSDCLSVVNMGLDLEVFNLGIKTPQQRELSNKRRQHYGRPGAFRPKSYGVELRCPANFWVAQEETMREAFRLVNKVMEEVSRGR